LCGGWHGADLAGDYFVPVLSADAGTFLGPGLTPDGTISGEGMDDDNAGLKTALSNADSTGFGMWLSDFFAVANGYSDPNSDAWISFDFGALTTGIDQMLVWNYNQATAGSRGMRRVDITYSTVDDSGLGNLLHDNYILNSGTGTTGMPYSNNIPLGTPGVGLNIRSIRITADGGSGIGNYGNAQDFYGLSEVRFYSNVNPLEPGPRVWTAGNGNWQGDGNWDIPDSPVTNQYSALFGDSIVEASTVYTNSAVSVNSITFNNANSYAIAGNGVVTLDAVSGNAKISVLGSGDVGGVAGSHQFQVPVALADNTVVTVGTGSSLAFNNQIDLGGRQLTLSGTNAINHSVVDSVGGGSIVMNGGSLGTAGNTGIGSSLALNGTSLEIDLRGSAGGVTSDQFNVAGSASLSGNVVVDVELINGYDPSGNVPILTTTGGITSSNLTLSLSGSGASQFTGIGIVGKNLVLLAAASQTGDYNQDGVVDAADYTVWRDKLGTNGSLPNDPIGGTIGAAQYQQWKANFGAGGAGAVATAVPEPTTACFLLFCTLILVFRSARD
jgi:hypothetical protein